jgi:hypothetical protein
MTAKKTGFPLRGNNNSIALMYGCPSTDWKPIEPIPFTPELNPPWPNTIGAIYTDKVPIILSFLDGFIEALEAQNIDASQAKQIREKIRTL